LPYAGEWAVIARAEPVVKEPMGTMGGRSGRWRTHSVLANATMAGRGEDMRFLRTLALAMFCACSLASGAPAQSYPDHPITMLVAFPPGGADDATARIVQDPMQRALGQPIVVENLGGAGGMLAAAKAARAAPDGYTILLHQVGLAAGMALAGRC
jgi:Tripartite tricarboxylate transporter family receptor